MSKLIEAGEVVLTSVDTEFVIGTPLLEGGLYALKLFLDYDSISPDNNVDVGDKFIIREFEPWDENDVSNTTFRQSNAQTIGQASDVIEKLIPKDYELGIRLTIEQINTGTAPKTIPFRLLEL